MFTKRLPVLIAAVLALALAAGGYYFFTTTRAAEAGALTASGTVEAVRVLIAPELSGKVAEVLVQEGDLVTAGQPLFRLDDTLLKAQRQAAAAGLTTAQAAAQTAQAAAEAAQAQYELALTGALAEQKALRSADWAAAKPADFNQPAWYFGRPEQAGAAQTEAAAAQTALDAARAALATVTKNAASGDFTAAETRLMNARAAFAVAQNVLALSTDPALRKSAQRAFDDAQAEVKSAQSAYDKTLSTAGAQDVLAARADLRVAQERADTAQDRVRALQTGALSPKVTAAQKALAQAQAAAAQAQAAVAQAEANVAVLDTQLGKLTVTAPADGVLLTRAIEPGEMALPNASLMTLARLSDLSITVYVPEDRYGALAVGQTAQVTADSFPGQTFTGQITQIADQAEFTPRNVQTTAGRKTTVFAIKLSLAEAGGKLKPGMPADVLFK